MQGVCGFNPWSENWGPTMLLSMAEIKILKIILYERYNSCLAVAMLLTQEFISPGKISRFFWGKVIYSIELASANVQSRPSTEELMLSNCGAREDSWESLGLQGDQTSWSSRKSILNIHWKDWCWSTNTLATWCEELAYLKRLWCWERLRAGEVDDRG